MVLDPRGATVHLVCPTAIQEPCLYEECEPPYEKLEGCSWTGARTRKAGEGEEES